MSRLTNSKKIKLLKIEKARLILSQHLKDNFITEKDIIHLIDKDINYGIRKSKERLSYKESVLKDIFNCPFLLCDQEYLSINIKKLLPVYLDVRYNTEKEMIEYYHNQCFISDEEYKEQLDELEFCYYKSSNDGKNILKTGCAVGISYNIMR